MSQIPKWDPTHKLAGPYDQGALNEAQPELKSQVLFEGKDMMGEEMRGELWALWDRQEADMKEMRHDFAPGQHDYYDDYNQVQLTW